MRRLSSPTTSLLPLLWALLPACSQPNADHCGNREGDLTCLQQGTATPHCSICVADNNGCVADRPDDACLATTAPATSAPSSSGAVDPTTGASESATSTTGKTTDPTTATTTTGQTDTSTTTATGTTTTTGDTSTSTDTTDTLDTLETLGTSTSTTEDTSTTGSTTMEGPVCGDNKVEGDEVCDGTNNNDQSCITVVPGKWGGGMLACNEGCQSYDDTECCIGVGQKCNYLTEPDEKCCGGLTCALDGTCKN
jgi:hypothetical protein